MGRALRNPHRYWGGLRGGHESGESRDDCEADGDPTTAYNAVQTTQDSAK